MPHPYTEHEGSALWDATDAALGDLDRNGDVALRTARTHVVGYLCQQLARAEVTVPAPASSVPMVLSADEALVLFDLLGRLADDGRLAAEHPAEQRVLWNLEARLERRLTEPLDPRYSELLAAARERVADSDPGE
jgi:hypothetical protein